MSICVSFVLWVYSDSSLRLFLSFLIPTFRVLLFFLLSLPYLPSLPLPFPYFTSYLISLPTSVFSFINLCYVFLTTILTPVLLSIMYIILFCISSRLSYSLILSLFITHMLHRIILMSVYPFMFMFLNNLII